MGIKPADTRMDLAMGVPIEFLASEMWFCTNCCKNPLFMKVLAEVRNLPILSNMTIMERICPAFGVCPVPFVKNSGVVNPNTAKEFMQPMKWMCDRPAHVVHEYAHKYRSDIPLRTAEPTVSADQIVPALRVDLFTMNFGDAADGRASEEFVERTNGWTIGNHLWVIAPCDTDQALRNWWLKSVAPLPREYLQYKERMAFSDAHEMVDQDIIQPGGDTGDIEAAFGEQEQDRFREQKDKDPSFGQAHSLCLDSVFEDDKGFISDEFRPLMKRILCKKDPTRINDAPHETKKFIR